MPKENISYSCNICGQRYHDYAAAEFCEKAHKLPVKVDKPEYCKTDVKMEYPMSVLVHFADKTSARYYRKGGR